MHWFSLLFKKLYPMGTFNGVLKDQSNWETAWNSFSGASLIGHDDANVREANFANCFYNACILLTHPMFSTMASSRQTFTILSICKTFMSVPSPDSIMIADLGLRQFRRMLMDPGLTEAEGMGIYDALHGMYFAGTTDVLDLRRFDNIVPAFEQWLKKRIQSRQNSDIKPIPPRVDGFINIAYFLHIGHFDRGNAVSPLIVSLAKMHSAMPNRNIFLYLVEYVGPDFLHEISDDKLTIRQFHQWEAYDRIDDIEESLIKDGIDVVITEQNRAIASSLFVRRVAPIQIWADTGFPFWNLSALDWTLSPVQSESANINRKKSTLTWRQAPETLIKETDTLEIQRIRDRLPTNKFVLGVFVRLIKLSDVFLELIERILSKRPEFHLIIAGTGDASKLVHFMQHSAQANQITFIHANVDLNIYGQVIDVMCDTFPFIGGNACREVGAHGTPVVSMLGTAWDNFLLKDRSPDLLARDIDSYIEIIDKLYVDQEFLRNQREKTLALYSQHIDPTQMISDVEFGITACMNKM